MAIPPALRQMRGSLLGGEPVLFLLAGFAAAASYTSLARSRILSCAGTAACIVVTSVSGAFRADNNSWWRLLGSVGTAHRETSWVLG